MKLTLVIESGDNAGKRYEVTPGKELRVGRDAPCEVRVPGDTMMSNPHFVISAKENAFSLRDQSKFGTFHNSNKVSQCELHHGDSIRAGRTEFRILVQDIVSSVAPTPRISGEQRFTPSVASPAPSGNARDLLAFLRSMPNLFAILDAARELTIPARLAESTAEHASLYELRDRNENGAISFGPWLVRLKPDSPLLEMLAREGWGKAWGVYLNSDDTFANVRHHLRRFLTVLLPGNKPAIFRFYDPRVLRVYLPMCTPDESANFYGPIKCYELEDVEAKNLLMFTARQPEPARVTVSA